MNNPLYFMHHYMDTLMVASCMLANAAAIAACVVFYKVCVAAGESKTDRMKFLVFVGFLQLVCFLLLGSMICETVKNWPQ